MYDDFLYTDDVKDSFSLVGSVMQVSKNGRVDGPISDVNLRFGCKAFSFSRKSSCMQCFCSEHAKKYHTHSGDVYNEGS